MLRGGQTRWGGGEGPGEAAGGAVRGEVGEGLVHRRRLLSRTARPAVEQRHGRHGWLRGGREREAAGRTLTPRPFPKHWLLRVQSTFEVFLPPPVWMRGQKNSIHSYLDPKELMGANDAWGLQSPSKSSPTFARGWNIHQNTLLRRGRHGVSRNPGKVNKLSVFPSTKETPIYFLEVRRMGTHLMHVGL